MLNLNVYNLRTKQNFMALLTQFEADGITDVRFIRARVQRHIETAVGVPGAIRRTRRKDTRMTTAMRCPEPKCNSIMIPVSTGKPEPGEEPLKILGCPVCRFSMVVE